MWRKSAFWIPSHESLNFRMVFPRVCPNSGSLFGPNKSRMMPAMIKWEVDIPNIIKTYLFLPILSILIGCEQSGFLEPSEELNSYQAVSGKQAQGERSRWEQIFSTSHYVYGKKPADILIEAEKFYPKQKGLVLDIAMGEGRNAVYLAKKGFLVLGVDFSDAAIRKALQLAREYQVRIKAVNADLREYEIDKNKYAMIININFLQRNLIPKIKIGLRSGGIVVFETYTVDQLKNEQGPRIAKEYLLEKGELKTAFEGFEFLFYSENNDGVRAKASLIARKL